MRAVRRALAAVFGVAGAVGLVLCVAGVVGCWVAHAEAGRRVDRTFGRAEASLGEVRDGLAQTGDRLRQTRGELDALRDRQAVPASRPPAERGLRRAAVNGVTARLADSRRQLVRATETALVAAGLLEALAELPLGERVGVEADRLRDAADRLGELVGRSERLAATLAAAPDLDDGAADEPSRLCQALDGVVAAADTGAERADAALGRVRAWHARVIGWLATTAVVTTLVLGWVGLGQLSLLVHGYVGVRRPVGGDPPGAERGHG